MRGYKFLRTEHLEAFLRGQLRVGTSEEYQVPDGEVGGRGDADDCAVIWSPPPGNWTGQEAVNFLRSISSGEDIPNDLPVEIRVPGGVTMVWRVPWYLFCFSTSVSTELVQRMERQFGYDACVEILDVDAFALALTASDPRLRREVYRDDGWDWVSAVVTYNKEHETTLSPTGTIMMKYPEYAWQNEARIAWPCRPPHQPIFVDAPSVADVVLPFDLAAYR